MLAAVLVLAFLGRARLPWKARLAGVLVLLLCLIPMAKLYTDTDIYTNKTENYDLINRWSTTQVYISKGFVYPFLYSVQSAIDTPPEGYDADEAAATLARYTDADIPENEKVDVIGIMLEAYADFSVYNCDPSNVDGVPMKNTTSWRRKGSLETCSPISLPAARLTPNAVS